MCVWQATKPKKKAHVPRDKGGLFLVLPRLRTRTRNKNKKEISPDVVSFFPQLQKIQATKPKHDDKKKLKRKLGTVGSAQLM
jgi:hypothetical protein